MEGSRVTIRHSHMDIQDHVTVVHLELALLGIMLASGRAEGGNSSYLPASASNKFPFFLYKIRGLMSPSQGSRAFAALISLFSLLR